MRPTIPWDLLTCLKFSGRSLLKDGLALENGGDINKAFEKHRSEQLCQPLELKQSLFKVFGTLTVAKVDLVSAQFRRSTTRIGLRLFFRKQSPVDQNSEIFCPRCNKPLNLQISNNKKEKTIGRHYHICHNQCHLSTNSDEEPRMHPAEQNDDRAEGDENVDDNEEALPDISDGDSSFRHDLNADGTVEEVDDNSSADGDQPDDKVQLQQISNYDSAELQPISDNACIS
ncbi:hypothetical protein E3N88_19476 [Mikania micrantha]|uniref:Uncharacterized protein n=1 Tax=Mikania micrantha TaxID=192012 RepID=A0A5N6NPY4_9ASTR|nr:hypothetical protein E3N88_19476 [Mikania micrantha]